MRPTRWVKRINDGETKDLAAQLPRAFAHDLLTQGNRERFSVQESCRRVAAHRPAAPDPCSTE